MARFIIRYKDAEGREHFGGHSAAAPREETLRLLGMNIQLTGKTDVQVWDYRDEADFRRRENQFLTDIGKDPKWTDEEIAAVEPRRESGPSTVQITDHDAPRHPAAAAHETKTVAPAQPQRTRPETAPAPAVQVNPDAKRG
jgi:hypothetical protein